MTVIDFTRYRRHLAAKQTETGAPYKGARRDLSAAIADGHPAYALFAEYKRAQQAYQIVMNDLARHTGYSVMQVAKFMQYRREGRT